jgi:hypothetical protein
LLHPSFFLPGNQVMKMCGPGPPIACMHRAGCMYEAGCGQGLVQLLLGKQTVGDLHNLST